MRFYPRVVALGWWVSWSNGSGPKRLVCSVHPLFLFLSSGTLHPPPHHCYIYQPKSTAASHLAFLVNWSRLLKLLLCAFFAGIRTYVLSQLQKVAAGLPPSTTTQFRCYHYRHLSRCLWLGDFRISDVLCTSDSETRNLLRRFGRSLLLPGDSATQDSRIRIH